jgi:alkane 1-monooxygenase
VFSLIKHLLCFVLPAVTFLFLVSGQHSVAGTIIGTIPFWLVLIADWFSPAYKPEPVKIFPEIVYDYILIALSILQLANIFLMLHYVSELRWDSNENILISSVNLIAIRFLVGTSSGTSGIVVAHELIHRTEKSWQLLGRLLLCTVCYDHFRIAHKRGHHLSLGLSNDLATAQLGESFNAYWRRVYLGYLSYSWHSEQDRLKQTSYKFKIIHNQVLQGLLVELTLIMIISIHFGLLSALMFIYQSIAAIRILEAVNYFQHWGLEKGQFGNTFGWVCHSSLSRYALIGLPHHIGHHENESKHFHEIAYSERGPLLPYGYFVMNLWVKLSNRSYQKMALRELENFRDSQKVQLKA